MRVAYVCMIGVKLCSHDTLVLHVSILCTPAAPIVACVQHSAALIHLGQPHPVSMPTDIPLHLSQLYIPINTH